MNIENVLDFFYGFFALNITFILQRSLHMHLISNTSLYDFEKRRTYLSAYRVSFGRLENFWKCSQEKERELVGSLNVCAKNCLSLTKQNPNSKKVINFTLNHKPYFAIMLLKFVDTFLTFLLKKELDILPSTHNSTIFLYFGALFCLPKKTR